MNVTDQNDENGNLVTADG